MLSNGKGQFASKDGRYCNGGRRGSSIWGPISSSPRITPGNHVVLRPSGNPRAPPPDQGTATDLRIGFHLYATARRLPFSGELAPRFQVNDATMRRSDWWKGGHVGVETSYTKRSWSFSIQSLDSSDAYIKAC